MEQRTLELQLVSAKDLKDVNLISKMDVYAVVSLEGDTYYGKQTTKTQVLTACGTHPTFNFPMRFTVDDSLALHNRLSLEIRIVSHRSLGDRDIGAVHVPVKELLDSADPKNMKFISYQVRRPSGRPKGELSFSYKFGDKVAAPEVARKGEPVTAYPVGGSSAPVYGVYPNASGSGYPPPPQNGSGYPEAPPPGYAYPPPQQAGYGYPPPPPPGYGYPPVQQAQPAKKNKFGMGLGAGLLGGVLGGMLIGDMVDGGGCGGGGCGGGGCGGGGCGGF